MNIETESRLLGSLLLDPEAFVHVAHMLQPEDFSREIHAIIYEAMLSLYKRQEPVTIGNVSGVLQQRGQLEWHQQRVQPGRSRAHLSAERAEQRRPHDARRHLQR